MVAVRCPLCGSSIIFLVKKETELKTVVKEYRLKKNGDPGFKEYILERKCDAQVDLFYRCSRCRWRELTDRKYEINVCEETGDVVINEPDSD